MKHTVMTDGLVVAKRLLYLVIPYTYCKVDGYHQADFTASLYVVHEAVQWSSSGW